MNQNTKVLALFLFTSLFLAGLLSVSAPALSAQQAEAPAPAKPATPDDFAARFAALIQDDGSCKPDMSFELTELGPALVRPYLVEWSVSTPSDARSHVRVIGSTLRLRSSRNQRVSGRFVPTLTSASLAGSLRADGFLTLEIVPASGARLELALGRDELRISRIVDAKDGPERRTLVKKLATPRGITGNLPFTLSVTESGVQAELGVKPAGAVEGVDGAEAAIAQVWCSLNEALAIGPTFGIALGSRDGQVAVSRGKLSGVVDADWWQNSGRALALASRLYDFQRQGAESLYSVLQHRLSDEELREALKSYSDQARELRGLSKFDEVLKLLPDNRLARFECAMHLRKAGRIPEALRAVTESMDSESPGMRGLQAELMLRTGRTPAEADLPKGAHYALLHGMLAVREKRWAQASAWFHEGQHPLKQALLASVAALSNPLSNQSKGRITTFDQVRVIEPELEPYPESDKAPSRRQYSPMLRALHSARAQLGRVIETPQASNDEQKPTLEVWLYSDPERFVSDVLVYAHEHITRVNGLFQPMQQDKDDVLQGRVFVCDSGVESDNIATMRHELWHATLHMHFPQLRSIPWVQEGMATLLERNDPSFVRQGVGTAISPPDIGELAIEDFLASLKSERDAAGWIQRMQQREHFFQPEQLDEAYLLAWAICTQHLGNDQSPLRLVLSSFGEGDDIPPADTWLSQKDIKHAELLIRVCYGKSNGG